MRDLPPRGRGDHRLRDYFDRDAEDYDQAFAERPDHRDTIRRITNPWNRAAVHGRLEAVLALAGPDLVGVRVLEVGCGSGRYSVALAERGALVTGIDFAPGMVRLSEKLAAERGVAARCRFMAADVFEYPTSEAHDLVVAAGVMDYIPPRRQGELLARLSTLSTRAVIVSFPKKWHYHAFARAIWLRLIKGVPVFFFTTHGIGQLLQASRLVPKQWADVGILVVVRAEHA